MEKTLIDTKSLEKAVWDSVDKQRKIYPAHTNRASSIGHPCMRYLVFERTRWQDKLLPEVELQFIFNEGNVQEEAVKETLVKAGFKISQQQRAYFETPQNLSGHLDAEIQHNELIPEPIPCEIKGLSQYNWESIDTYEDIINHKEWYVRKYPAQLQLYLYMASKEQGLFVLKNKQNGRIKFILIELDYSYVETLLKRSELINKLVAEKATPDPYDGIEVCQRCEFRHICFKDQTFGSGIIALDDEQLAQQIVRVQELRASNEEFEIAYNIFSEQIKERAEKQSPNAPGKAMVQFLIGDYVINCSRVAPKDKKPYWKIGEIEKV